MKRISVPGKVVLAVVAALLISCQQQTVKQQPQYQVELKRTSYGIPHITAADFGSLGYGEGYAAAQDHVCNIADAIVVARGERAKYHGTGENGKYLAGDVVIRALGIPSRAQQELAAQSPEDREWITGFAAGYNRYIRDTGRENITSWCKGAEWVREISPADLFARFQVLAQTAPRMAGMITAAAPPDSEQISKQDFSPPPAVEAEIAAALSNLKTPYLGSNGWAIGSDRTENGHGMLLGNPHYPWNGSNRFWEKHLVIPGRLNIYGVHLIGIPGVSIGFNEAVGWTHTVSASERVVFYKLDLVPGDPTSYFYDGEPRKMTARTVSVPVRDEDGVENPVEHTVWFSHYGPIVSMPGAPWSDRTAIAMRDANFPNQKLFAQWRAMDMAADMDALKEAHRRYNAIPWVNTMAVSSDGRAVYIDGSNVGRLSEEAIAMWRERVASDDLTRTFYRKRGLILLDGSDSRFEWQAHPDARVPGVVPYVEQPKLERRDYIFNSNDSYWLSNAEHPMSGYSPLYGRVEAARSLRTRMNAMLLSDTSPSGPSGADGKFSLREMQQAILSNRSLSAELLLDELIAACTASPSALVDGQRVDLGAACATLKEYNGHLDLQSRGAVLFREWITRYPSSAYRQAGELFAVPFDPRDPVNTPRGLADPDLALQKLAEAVLTIQAAGLDLETPLGAVQIAYRGDEKIAVHGGNNAEGIANIIGQWHYDAMIPQVWGNPVDGSRYLTDKGYPVTYGTSFLLSLSYTDDGPVAEAFLTYAESGDPTSPHYTDQTKRFARKQWRPVLYRTEDIDRNVESTVVLTEPR